MTMSSRRIATLSFIATCAWLAVCDLATAEPTAIATWIAGFGPEKS